MFTCLHVLANGLVEILKDHLHFIFSKGAHDCYAVGPLAPAGGWGGLPSHTPFTHIRAVAGWVLDKSTLQLAVRSRYQHPAGDKTALGSVCGEERSVQALTMQDCIMGIVYSQRYQWTRVWTRLGTFTSHTSPSWWLRVRDHARW